MREFYTLLEVTINKETPPAPMLVQHSSRWV